MEAEIKIIEVLLDQARVLKRSKDPEETIAAARWEIRLVAELAELRKKKARQPAMAGG